MAGGSGSGKSSICKHLQKDHNALIIDCDKLGHQCQQVDTPCYKDLVAAFGDTIINEGDRTINRPALGKIVFSDPAKLQQLNGICWPHIMRMAKEQIAENPQYSIVVLDAA